MVEEKGEHKRTDTQETERAEKNLNTLSPVQKTKKEKSKKKERAPPKKGTGKVGGVNQITKTPFPWNYCSRHHSRGGVNTSGKTKFWEKKSGKEKSQPLKGRSAKEEEKKSDAMGLESPPATMDWVIDF